MAILLQRLLPWMVYRAIERAFSQKRPAAGGG
jgi:hypothetical protein